MDKFKNNKLLDVSVCLCGMYHSISKMYSHSEDVNIKALSGINLKCKS